MIQILTKKTNHFKSYFYEPFTNTLNRHPDSDKVFDLYKKGMEEGVFQMQLHGREHVHVNNWLHKLRNQDEMMLEAFKERMFTLNNHKGCSCRYECLDAMAVYNENDLMFIQQAIKEGSSLFEKTWGFKSNSVIAPCYSWPSKLETTFKDCGIKYIQGARAQKEYTEKNDKVIVKRHYMGQKNHEGMFYLMRNVNFEQVENTTIDIVAAALSEIDNAFTWKKPAVITSHRVNYIGSIDPKNSVSNLKLLKQLLLKIVEKYPTVEFMSTDELGNLIASN